jgi:hypothetical protein
VILQMFPLIQMVESSVDIRRAWFQRTKCLERCCRNDSRRGFRERGSRMFLLRGLCVLAVLWRESLREISYCLSGLEITVRACI